MSDARITQNLLNSGSLIEDIEKLNRTELLQAKAELRLSGKEEATTPLHLLLLLAHGRTNKSNLNRPGSGEYVRDRCTHNE